MVLKRNNKALKLKIGLLAFIKNHTTFIYNFNNEKSEKSFLEENLF